MTDPAVAQPEALPEAEFRTLLAENGLALEGTAFAAALQGARHLRTQVAQLAAYLDAMDAEA